MISQLDVTMDDLLQTARAAHYREMASETYDLAERTEIAELIGAYLNIAARWTRLAEKAELEARRCADIPG